MFESRPIIPIRDGWLEVRVPQDIMKDVWSMVDLAKVDAKDKLAGNISSSLEMDPTDMFRSFMDNVTNEYREQFNYKPNQMVSRISDDASLQLHDLWVNWQYQTEFNPSHVHFGAFSFVIWLKMPVDTRDQLQLPFASKTTSQCVSCFQFEYVNIFGHRKSFNYPMGEQMEGIMVFFPAEMNHLVYPFYGTDEHRVSVAGNMAWF